MLLIFTKLQCNLIPPANHKNLIPGFRRFLKLHLKNPLINTFGKSSFLKFFGSSGANGFVEKLNISENCTIGVTNLL